MSRKGKDILIDDVKEVMTHPGAIAFYEANLTGAPQKDTIKALAQGLRNGELTIEEALSVAFLVGLQWKVKFD